MQAVAVEGARRAEELAVEELMAARGLLILAVERALIQHITQRVGQVLL